jgi:hypothetical protein
MSNPPANPSPDSVPKPSLPRRLFSWRMARRCMIGLAVLVTLFALFHVEENWRGQRAWNKYRAEMEARGAIFDIQGIIPPPVPDDQNFAMTPLLKPVLDIYTHDEMLAKGLTSRHRDTNGYARASSITIHGPEPDFHKLSHGNDILQARREYRESRSFTTATSRTTRPGLSRARRRRM